MKTSTQSPRAKRESTNDPERWSKGEVRLGMDTPRKGGQHVMKAAPSDPFDVEQDRGGDGNRAA
jgi:hypothetical protein